MHIASIAVLRALFLSFGKCLCMKQCFKLFAHWQQGLGAAQVVVIQTFRV